EVGGAFGGRVFLDGGQEDLFGIHGPSLLSFTAAPEEQCAATGLHLQGPIRIFPDSFPESKGPFVYSARLAAENCVLDYCQQRIPLSEGCINSTAPRADLRLAPATGCRFRRGNRAPRGGPDRPTARSESAERARPVAAPLADQQRARIEWQSG